MGRTGQTIWSGFLFALLLLLLSGCGRDRTAVATVNGQKIPFSEYHLASENRLLLSGKKELNPEEKKEILDGLIDRELLRQGAARQGLTASEAEVKARLDRVKGKMGEKEFETWLKQKDTGLREFRSSIEKEIVAEKFRDSLALGVSADSAEIEAYYREHAEDFVSSPLYKVYIIKTFGGEEAGDMLMRFKSRREDFDAWALQRSPEDVRLMNRNARLTPEDDFPEAMAAMMRTMRPGEIGGPVKTKAGFFLFKLLDKEKGRKKELGEVAAGIGHLLLEEKKEAKVLSYIAAQKAVARVAVTMSK